MTEIDPDTNRVAAERLSDQACVVFDGDYVSRTTSRWVMRRRCTRRKGSPPTAPTRSWVKSASRAMLYVAMTRGRHNNEAFLYQKFSNEADHEHTKPVAGDSIHIAARRVTNTQLHTTSA